MKITSVYTQEEDNKHYTYRFEFKDVIYYIYPSFMLHSDSHRVVNSMLDNLHEYNSLSKIKPYENIRN